MTEQEYFYTNDLQKLSIIRKILTSIFPEYSLIKKKEYVDMHRKLNELLIRYNKKIKIK